MELHPDLEVLRPLLGEWSGSGRGEYPTIEPFTYAEVASFTPGPAKPYVLYSQRTVGADGTPLHAEVGYLRMTAAGPELIIAQPTGLAEVHTGELTGNALVFRSETVQASPTAKPVSQVVRRLVIDGDVLRYTLDMAYAGEPLGLHLEATLRRAPGGADQPAARASSMRGSTSERS